MDSLYQTIRNEEWMKNIIPMIHEGSSLMAVGAGHLIGVNGLIAKERKELYTIQRNSLTNSILNLCFQLSNVSSI